MRILNWMFNPLRARFLIVSISGLLLVGGFSSKVLLSYGLETHFYMTYYLARMAGFNHKMSSLIASSNEQVDEATSTSPFWTRGGRIRFHFPSATLTGSIDKKDLMGTLVKGVNLAPKTEPNSNFASWLIFEGLKRGDIIMVSAGIHVLQDSFGHAGYEANLGHADGAHVPDRPSEKIDFFNRMTRRVLQALVALRDLMPEEALVEGASRVDAETLHERFLADQGMQDWVKTSFVTDSRYTKLAIMNLFREAEANGFIKKGSIEQLFPADERFHQGKDVRTILVEHFMSIPRDQLVQGGLDLEKVLAEHARGVPMDAILQDEDRRFLIEQIVNGMTRSKIPTRISILNPRSFEAESPIRDYEKALAISTIQKLIQERVGTLVAYVHKPGRVKRIWNTIKGWWAQGSAVAELALNDTNVPTQQGVRLSSAGKRGFWSVVGQRWKPMLRADERAKWYQFPGMWQQLKAFKNVFNPISVAKVEKALGCVECTEGPQETALACVRLEKAHNI